MTTDTKVAELLPCPFCGSQNIDPKGWASTDSAGPACDDCGASAGDTSGSLQDNIAAWNRRAALARQEADKTAAPVGQEIAYLDLGVGGYIDLGSAMTDEQLAKLPKGRHALGIIGTYGVDGYVAAPPSAPVGQEAVAWRYWSPSGNCWWTRYVAPTEDTSPESTNWEPLYAAPPAAHAVDLSDDFSESKDWRESDYNGRIDWLKEMHASQRAEIVRLQNDVGILRALVDQQAGKGVDL